MSGVSGGAQLRALGANLHEAGDKGLVRELRRGAEQGVKPLSQAIASGSPEYIPHGYEQTFAAALAFSTSVRTRGKSAAVEHVTKGKGRVRPRQIRAINEGWLRHPVFGRVRRLVRHWIHKATTKVNPWVRQTIRRGFWDDPVEANEKHLKDEMQAVMRRVADKITTKG